MKTEIKSLYLRTALEIAIICNIQDSIISASC